jgi:hypothetical protein
VAHTTFGNIGRHQSSSITVTSNASLFKKITININTSVRHIKYSTIVNNSKGFTLNIFAALNYRFRTNWIVNSDLSYNSSNISIQGKTAGYIKSSLSVNKRFIKDKKAMVSLMVSNPFQSKRHLFSETNDPAFYQLQESWVITRRYTMSFSYRFGKTK